jgi:F-type H+-transporting ATPase subunit epsilon
VSEKLKLDIVTPYGSVFNEEVDEITAAGSEGEFGVLPGHAPFLTTLKSGRFSCKTGAENIYFFVNWGYAEVGPEKVIILADSAELSTDIDVERAHEARQRAEERLKKEEEIDFTRAEAALERAITRIRIAEEHAAPR